MDEAERKRLLDIHKEIETLSRNDLANEVGLDSATMDIVHAIAERIAVTGARAYEAMGKPISEDALAYCVAGISAGITHGIALGQQGILSTSGGDTEKVIGVLRPWIEAMKAQRAGKTPVSLQDKLTVHKQTHPDQ